MTEPERHRTDTTDDEQTPTPALVVVDTDSGDVCAIDGTGC